MDQTFIAARRALQMGQVEMAAALDISQASVSRIERGVQQPSGLIVLKLQRLARMRGIDLTWPLDGEKSE